MALPTIFYGKKLCPKVRELTELKRGDPLRSEAIHRALDNYNYVATRSCIYPRPTCQQT
jgi:hypothetical protein